MWDRRGREAAGDCATSRSVKAFQSDDTGNTKEKKLYGWSIKEKRQKKRFVQQREGLPRGLMRKLRSGGERENGVRHQKE